MPVRALLQGRNRGYFTYLPLQMFLQQALTDIAAFDICRAHGIIIAESAVDTVLPEMPAPYALYREYRYGKIKLTVYHRGGNEDTE